MDTQKKSRVICRVCFIISVFHFHFCFFFVLFFALSLHMRFRFRFFFGRSSDFCFVSFACCTGAIGSGCFAFFLFLGQIAWMHRCVGIVMS